MPMPTQRPGQSFQAYRTPPELITAIKKRLHITDFDADLAADSDNTVATLFYSEENSAFDHTWKIGTGWNWCNPPFANIAPWVERAADEAQNGAQTVMLIPASVGANWWLHHVLPNAYQVFLNGRLTFVGCVTPYPKDCALLFFTPWRFRGIQIWNWRETLTENA